MKRYKSILKEQNDFVVSKNEIKKIDVSDLKFFDETGEGLMSYIQAENQTPSGFRLPTVFELYSAYEKGMTFERSSLCWTSSKSPNGNYWMVNFYNGALVDGVPDKGARLVLIQNETTKINHIVTALIHDLETKYSSPNSMKVISNMIIEILLELERNRKLNLTKSDVQKILKSVSSI